MKYRRLRGAGGNSTYKPVGDVARNAASSATARSIDNRQTQTATDTEPENKGRL